MQKEKAQIGSHLLVTSFSFDFMKIYRLEKKGRLFVVKKHKLSKKAEKCQQNTQKISLKTFFLS